MYDYIKKMGCKNSKIYNLKYIYFKLYKSL